MSNEIQSIQPTAGTVAGLVDLIDWPLVMSQPRGAGGHDEVVRSIFGPSAEVIAWWHEGDYQGTVAIAYKLSDGRIAVMTDYYGSCSGCDAWEDATDDSARKMVVDLVNSAKVFNSLEDAKAWCATVDDRCRPENYPFYSAKNLWPVKVDDV